MAKLNLKSVYTNESTYTVLQLLYNMCDTLDTWDLNNIEFVDYNPSGEYFTYKLITYPDKKVAVDYAKWAGDSVHADTAGQADLATQAEKDGKGNNIADTYALKTDVKPVYFEVLDATKINTDGGSNFSIIVRTGFRYYDSSTKYYWYFFNIKVQQTDSYPDQLHLLYNGKVVNNSLGQPISLDKSAINNLLFCKVSD